MIHDTAAATVAELMPFIYEATHAAAEVTVSQ